MTIKIVLPEGEFHYDPESDTAYAVRIVVVKDDDLKEKIKKFIEKTAEMDIKARANTPDARIAKLEAKVDALSEHLLNRESEGL